MRIRSIRPEFWRSDDVAKIPCQLIYDGPVPPRLNDIAPMCSECEYVYLLFGEGDALVYVGRSFRPADRMTKHRRKSWWHLVNGMAIIRVSEGPHSAPRPRWSSGANTALLESLAISRLAPSSNVAAPLRKVVS